MKTNRQIFFVLVITVLYSSTESHFFGEGQSSGNLQLSGLLNNHPIIKHFHKNKGAGIAPVPVVEEVVTPEPEPVIENEIPASSGGGHDIHKIIGDILGVKIMLLKHVQSGITGRLDKHIKHIERFESHVKNHFNKNSGSAAAADSNDSDFTLTAENEGDSISSR